MYSYERFGTVTLPIYERESDHSPIPARVGVVGTIAGAYDTLGADDAPQELPYNVSVRGVVLEDTAAALRTTLDGLRAEVGKRKNLYRRADDDGEIQWARARLVSEPMRRVQGNVLHCEVEMVFQILTPWVGADHSVWVLDAGELLDDALYLDEGGETFTGSSPHIFTATNGGNRAVTNPVITVTAGGANITSVTITKVGSGGSETKIVWTDAGTTGALATTKSLVIDCGKFTITDDGANAYSGKAAFDSNHTIAEWLRLDPGYNEVTVTWVGGSTNSTVLLEFRDGWA